MSINIQVLYCATQGNLHDRSYTLNYEMEKQPSSTSIVRSADHLTQQQATLQGKVTGQITEVSLCLCSLPTGSDRQAEG